MIMMHSQISKAITHEKSAKGVIMLAYCHKYKDTALQRCQYTKILMRNESYVLSQTKP